MTSLFKKSFNIMKATFVIMKQHFSIAQFSMLYKDVHGSKTNFLTVSQLWCLMA